MARMFGTDGVRGKANVELTPELACCHLFYEERWRSLHNLYW